MTWADELARQGGEGTQGVGAGELQVLGRQSLSTQQALDPVVTVSHQAVPGSRSMPGTKEMAKEETNR